MRILYVEDHPDTASAMRMLLEMKGHEVTVALTASKAKALCIDHIFDVWILDLHLPDAHGGDLLRFLRRLSDTPAIALTGYGAAHEIAEGWEDGFDDYLVKPVDLEKVLAALKRVTSGTNATSTPAPTPLYGAQLPDQVSHSSTAGA